MALIIICVLILETSILFGWCMFQRRCVQTTAEMHDYWHSQANILSEELHELKEENCSLGQLLDDYKRTIAEQNEQLTAQETTLKYIKEYSTNKLKGYNT